MDINFFTFKSWTLDKKGLINFLCRYFVSILVLTFFFFFQWEYFTQAKKLKYGKVS